MTVDIAVAGAAGAERRRRSFYAARTVLRKFSTSVLRLPLCIDRESADAGNLRPGRTGGAGAVIDLGDSLRDLGGALGGALGASPTLRAISAVAAPSTRNRIDDQREVTTTEVPTDTR
jgi:hypothetical protein